MKTKTKSDTVTLHQCIKDSDTFLFQWLYEGQQTVLGIFEWGRDGTTLSGPHAPTSQSALFSTSGAHGSWSSSGSGVTVPLGVGSTQPKPQAAAHRKRTLVLTGMQLTAMQSGWQLERSPALTDAWIIFRVRGRDRQRLFSKGQENQTAAQYLTDREAGSGGENPSWT